MQDKIKLNDKDLRITEEEMEEVLRDEYEERMMLQAIADETYEEELEGHRHRSLIGTSYLQESWWELEREWLEDAEHWRDC